MPESIHKLLKIDHLKKGTPRQRSAYEAIADLNILNVLSPYNPILAGTIPIGLDLPDSDLDIICEVHHFKDFEKLLVRKYGSCEEFRYKVKKESEHTKIVCRFEFKGWWFEIYGQSLPTMQQNAYRHMVVEHRILNVLGGRAREFVMNLKHNGIKTEPAFGKMLRIQGDPYKFLLRMYEWDDRELAQYLKRNSVFREATS